MKTKMVGHDPESGKKFLSEQDGLVFGFGKSLEQNSDPNPLAKYQTAQEAHDEQALKEESGNRQTETAEDAIRAEALRRLRVRDLMRGRVAPTQPSSTSQSSTPEASAPSSKGKPNTSR